jgi:hypothetical protein
MEFSSFWHGGEFPPHCWICLKSFIDHGHNLTLYCYRDLGVPAGVQIRDAEEILPATSIFYYEKGPGTGSISAFSNVFRYKLLADRGGWWVDVDVLCMSDNLPEQDIAFGWESEQALGTAILKLPIGHSLSTQLFRSAMDIVTKRGSELEWGEIGPRLFLRLVSECGLLSLASPVSVFYPIEWTEAHLMLLPEQCDALLERTTKSSFLHLWNEVFRRGNFNLSKPPAGSFLSSIFARYSSPT